MKHQFMAHEIDMAAAQALDGGTELVDPLKRSNFFIAMVGSMSEAINAQDPNEIVAVLGAIIQMSIETGYYLASEKKVQ